MGKIADKIAEVLDDKKAVDVSVIDVSKLSDSMTDYLIIATSLSTPQTNAIAKGVDDGLQKMGYNIPPWQGKLESNWLILDLGSIIVHIMGPEERKRYSLEDIWGKSAVTYHV